MKKILAVSGGVDSMVMVDFLLQQCPKDQIIVAHFDHGTRPSSKDDFKFVQNYCQKVGLEFVGEHAKLGTNVSEATAREERYAFLKQVAKQNNGTIFTAHHLDDLVESVAINFVRGTGWRGLAVLNASQIERPLINWTKNDILKYAAKNHIIFRQDPTNTEENYLRNRLRPLIKNLDENIKRQIADLREKQIKIAEASACLCSDILPQNHEWQRAWFDNLDPAIAIELLKTKVDATRPQLLDFLKAIQTYQPGKCFNLPNDKLIKFSKNTFVL